MKQKIIIPIVIAVILVGGGIVFFLSQNNADKDNKSDGATSSTPSSNNETTSPATTTDTTSALTITYTDNGFDKASYTVKAGSVVTVKNESNMSIQFSSDNHPTHLEDPEINMEELSPGASGTFTPTTKGTHKFHDHLNDQFTGILVVE